MPSFRAACFIGLEIFEGDEGLLRHIPLAQNLVDVPVENPAATSRRTTRAVSFSFAGFWIRFRSSVPRQRFLVRLAVARAHRLCNHFRANALLLQILAHAPRAQLLVFLPQPRIGLRKRLIVEIAMLLEPRDRRPSPPPRHSRPAPPACPSAAAVPPPCASAAPAPSRRTRTAPPRPAARAPCGICVGSVSFSLLAFVSCPETGFGCLTVASG